MRDEVAVMEPLLVVRHRRNAVVQQAGVVDARAHRQCHVACVVDFVSAAGVVCREAQVRAAVGHEAHHLGGQLRRPACGLGRVQCHLGENVHGPVVERGAAGGKEHARTRQRTERAGLCSKAVQTHLFTAANVKYCSDAEAAPPTGDAYTRCVPATEPT